MNGTSLSGPRRQSEVCNINGTGPFIKSPGQFTASHAALTSTTETLAGSVANGTRLGLLGFGFYFGSSCDNAFAIEYSSLQHRVMLLTRRLNNIKNGIALTFCADEYRGESLYTTPLVAIIVLSWTIQVHFADK